jgi:endonuclease/exonuclease/phosphatase family metal-dependent hydrolase
VPALPRALPFALSCAVCACGGESAQTDAGPGGPDGPADAAIYEPPRVDLVPAVGSDGTIDIATWNIENFPAAPSTPRLVADLVASLELDLVAVEEIADVAAFEEVIARLPDHAGLLSSHTYGDGSYQKVGFIYREGLVELEGGALLFGTEGFDFPRPALSARATIDGHTITAIVLHLKAGVGDDDVARRTSAIVTLEAHLRTLADGDGDPDVIVLGDFNQGRLSAEDDAVWAPIVGAPDRYDILTQASADGGEVSYLPFGGRLIDHAVVNRGFELGAPAVVVPHLDAEPIDYTDTVSDHRPVVLSFPR